MWFVKKIGKFEVVRKESENLFEISPISCFITQESSKVHLFKQREEFLFNIPKSNSKLQNTLQLHWNDITSPTLKLPKWDGNFVSY